MKAYMIDAESNCSFQRNCHRNVKAFFRLKGASGLS